VSHQRGRTHDLAFGLLLSLASLVPRLYVALLWAREPVWDGHYYDFGAKRLAAGLGYSDDALLDGVSVWHPWCHYPVGYSGFLAAVYKLLGAGPHAATVANALLGAALVLLTHQLATRWLSRPRARIAAVLCALHPGLILYSAVIMTELLAAFLCLLAAWLLLLDRDRNPLRAVVISGVVVGLGTLVSPPAILIAPALGFMLLDPQPARQAYKKALGRGALACVVALAVVTPWNLRNCRVMDGCAFVSTNGGWNLAIGAFKRATGRFETLRASDGCEVVTGQVHQDRCWGRLGWQAIRNDPIRWLKLAPKKLGFCFDHLSFPVEYLATADPARRPQDRRARWRGLLTTTNRLLLSVALFGFIARPVRRWWAERAWRPALIEGCVLLVAGGLIANAWHDAATNRFWPLAVAIALLGAFRRSSGPRRSSVGVFVTWMFASFVLVHVVFFGEDRYAVPLIPLMCLLAAAALRTAGSETGSCSPGSATTG
jgi:4-amino-4-deoxy-L-arabinose transferase-like glycosyltransferase